MGASAVATVERITPPTLLQELAMLDAPALAARLEVLADQQARLNAALVYGTRRLATLARAAERAVDERIGIEGVMRLTGRSRSWIEHHPDTIPGRCQARRGDRVRWWKTAVERWVAAGGC